jgi:RNA polymerase sigma factor (sigma-70 family)
LTDRELLQQYAKSGSEDLFRQLVERHADLVYASCLRRLGDAHLAEDAAQAVFIILAKKAPKIGRGVVLSNWLFKTAGNVAANALRSLRRRRKYEAKSGSMADAARQSGPEGLDWSAVRPHLDRALDSLPEQNRSAVLMHYMQGKNFQDLAVELECNSDTARMRATRGLERMRKYLCQRGVSAPALMLAGTLGGEACQAAPAGLVNSITSATFSATGSSSAAISLAEGTMKAMVWAKIKVAALVFGIVATVSGGGIMAQRLLAAEKSSKAAPAEVPAGAKDILTENSYWRWHVTMKPPTYTEGGQEKTLKRKLKARLHGDADQLSSPPPSSQWIKTDFDDLGWARSRIKWCRGLAFSKYSTTRVCFRGKFNVTNPGAADLYLSMKYIGGAVVYLNGKEVIRSDMPDGKVGDYTCAKEYQKKHYCDDKGKLLAMRGTRDRLKNNKSRIRELQSTRLPGALLKKGVNVLAVAMHRSPYLPICQEWYGSKKALGVKPWWQHVDLLKVSLQCSGAGATANVGRPSGVQVWIADRNDRVVAADYGDPPVKGDAVRIVAARNGSFCGQIVIGSPTALSGIKVKVTDLSGPGKIPAANIKLLYGRMDWPSRQYLAWSHGLLEKVPASVPVFKKQGAVLPVLIRVKVPAGAAAGDYKGSVQVTASGKNFKLPVELYVADWALPDAKNYRTYMGVYQSPTSLALKYKVKLWSEEHWKLIEKSLALLGRIGNKMINVPVVEETQLGNDQAMVRWIKKGSGWEYDFSVMDRYIDTTLKYCGKQNYVCLQIWHAGGWSHRKADNKCTVTIVDKIGGGKVSSQQVPVFGSAESVAFWKPVLAAIQSRLTKKGMPKAMTVGLLSDSTAPEEVFKMFKQAWPAGDAMWHRGCHGVCRAVTPYPVGKSGGNRVQLHEHCYGMSMVRPEVKPLPDFHKFRGRPGTAYFRVSGHENCTTLVSYRTMAERGLYCGKQGIGRICLDFFSVMGKNHGPTKQLDIYNRFPHSSCSQRQPTLKKMAWVAPDGPATTMRYEALCEGVQESEAVIIISEGVANSAKVGAKLAGECEKLIRDRIMFCHSRNQTRWSRSYVHMNHSGWRALARRTFDLAAQVAKKLK